MTADAMSILGGLRLETGETWGECATDVQVADASAMLDPASPVVRRWVGRSRGYSKTSDAAGWTVAALLAGLIAPGERGYLVAADRDQARLTLDAVGGFCARTPGLAGALDLGSWAVTSRSSGASVIVLASDASSAFGLRGSFWIIDELTSWADTDQPRRFWEAVSSAWPKVPCRVGVISTAGTFGHWSRAVYESALGDDLWSVSDVHGQAPWLDPALIEGERRRLPASSFARLWQNVWTDAGDEALCDSEALDACIDGAESRPARPGIRYAIGVDLGIRNDASAVAVAHLEVVAGVRHVVLDRLDVFAPARGRDVSLATVRDCIAARAREYFGARVMLDRWQALGIAQELGQRGVRVAEVEMGSSAISRRALALRQLIGEQRLHLIDDDVLRDEFLNVRLIERSGSWRVDHAHGKHDDRVQAVAYAAEHLLLARSRQSVIVGPGGATRQGLRSVFASRG